jgi:hypothetical protein
LPEAVQKLNVMLMCVLPVMVPILRPAAHIRNFVRSSVWNVSTSPVHFMAKYIYIYIYIFILFHYHLKPDVFVEMLRATENRGMSSVLKSPYT